MKKLFLLFLMLLPMATSAETVEIDGVFYNLIFKAKLAEVTKNPDNYYTGVITIPESVNYEGVNYSVTSIGESAFSNCSYLISISLPNSITSIGFLAFERCGGLKTIEIPNSVTIIGNSAFDRSGLTSVVIGNGVATIERHAFANCRNLTSVTIPSNVKEIKMGAFSGSGLNEVHITDLTAWCNIDFEGQYYNNYVDHYYSNPLSIAHHLFLNGEEVEELVIPEDVTSIHQSVFAGATNLTSVIIPNSVTSIDGGAFMGCSGLSTIDIPNSVTFIGNGAFYGCVGLVSVNLPKDIIAVRSSSFAYCSKLKTIDIGNVQYLWSRAFADCTELTDVYCHNNDVPDTKSDTFENSLVEYVTLHIPMGTKDKYQSASPWKDFGTIVEMPKSLYSLIYVVDGETYKVYELKEGDAITTEPEPTKEGYTFSGWSEIPETMPAKDVTIAGTFTVNKYKLSYTIDGKEYKSYEVEYGADITAEPTPTKEGYTFSGWSVIPETMPAKDVEVNGTFTINKYKLTYTIDGEEYKSYEVEYGTDITAEPTPSKEGYTFSGWSEIPETMPAKDVEITGTFTINKYKLTYTIDGEEYKSYEVEYGTDITAEPTPTKEGYTFSGWSEIPESMPAKDVTISGSFSINSYKLTYMIDDEVYKEVTYEYGSTITPEQQPEGNYETFEWTDLPQTMPAHDVVVHATYTTGIVEVLMSSQRNVRIYSPNGKKRNKLQKGLNIVIFDDGTVKKIVLK